jgi:hypothetical protein
MTQDQIKPNSIDEIDRTFKHDGQDRQERQNRNNMKKVNLREKIDTIWHDNQNGQYKYY